MSCQVPQKAQRRWLPVCLLVGDLIMILGGLLLAYWLRYETPLGSLFIEVSDARFSDYVPLLALGCLFLTLTFAHNGLYDERLVLRHYQASNIILKGLAFWVATYLGVSLVLKFSPPISRIFVIYAGVCTALLLQLWRSVFHHLLLTNPALSLPLRQKVVILGWSGDAERLVESIASSNAHPYRLLGLVRGPGDPDSNTAIPSLGNLTELHTIFDRHQPDVLIAARMDLPRETLTEIVEACERRGVELKLIPSVFQIFVTGLRLQTIGAVPILGVEELALGRLLNRLLKRGVDMLGAVLLLVPATPLMLVLAWMIRRESPGAPLLFRQTRVGRNNRSFTMLKLRSMRPDAEKSDHLNISTRAGDPRLLRVGAWMRVWNLDELPQLLNVLVGDMSLVGPRPERPVHAGTLSTHIPHYMPRHLVKPGMTGWAQVNGLRGDCSMERRIQHDLYYIENWSLWLDLQILLLTLLRWKNKVEDV